jgi:hypothetical protein
MNVVLSVMIVRMLMFFNVQVRSPLNHYCPSVPRFAPVDQSDGKWGSIYTGKFQQKPADFQAESESDSFSYKRQQKMIRTGYYQIKKINRLLLYSRNMCCLPCS